MLYTNRDKINNYLWELDLTKCLRDNVVTMNQATFSKDQPR